MKSALLLILGDRLSFVLGAVAGIAAMVMVAPACAASRNTPIVISGSALGTVIIVDGDTIKIDGVKIRIVDIDTPETFRSRCENELKLGLKAKERLRALLDAGPVTYEATGTDRYRRTLARVYAGGVDVGDVLLAEGLALRYQPDGTAKLQRLQAWCGPNAQLNW